ncbi:MAG TPA: YceI family protein [Myxococcales bacterium]|nr:YceI family protein [Myxococcales bacterium]
MAAETWEFDVVHSSINFWVRHLMVSKVRGRFTRWTGKLSLDEQNPAGSSVEAQIEADSIDTREEQRDAHLRSPDFLDVAKFPQLTFRSRSVQKAGDGRYTVQGELTLHGVTKPVTLAVEHGGRARDPWGGERTGFSAHTSLDRKDFGLGWNKAIEAGGVMVGEKVEIDIEIEAKRQSAAKPAEARQ